MNLKYLSYLCIASAIVLGGYSYLTSKQSERWDKINTISQDDKINFRLQSVDRKKKLLQLQMKSLADEQEIRGALEQSLRNHKTKIPSGIDDREEMSLENIYKHLHQDRAQKNSEPLLDDKVIEELNSIRDEQEYMKAYRKAYIDAFVENARQNGVKVKVDENLNVYSQ